MRYARYLRKRYRLIFGYAGLIWALIGGVILSPLLCLLAYPEEAGLAWGFLVPGLGLTLAGLFCWRLLTPRGEGASLAWHEGTVIIVLAWGAASLVGAVPFLMIPGFGFTRALFESTSGWTTTGLSVVDTAQASHLILFYRSVTQLAGGGGFAIVVLAALAGPAGSGLSAAEGRADLLEPNVRRSASIVLRIYLGYVAAGVLAFWAAGMGFFDALNHAFAAVSTGGFSTRPASIGHWDSVWIEAVCIPLMILGSTNFLTSYALVRGRLGLVARTGEVRLVALLIPVGVVLLLFGVALGLYPALGKAVRVAVFETVTALTTTGFSTVGYTDWPDLGWAVLLVLMLVGGGSGSTAGGLKQYRVYVLYKSLLGEVRRLFSPPHTVIEPEVWQGERHAYLDDAVARQVGVFAFVYFAVFAAAATVATAYGYPLRESLFEIASSLGTVGLSVGVTAYDAPAGLLWTQIFCMFLGRLEFFAVLVGLTKVARDTRAMFA